MLYEYVFFYNYDLGLCDNVLTAKEKVPRKNVLMMKKNKQNNTSFFG